MFVSVDHQMVLCVESLSSEGVLFPSGGRKKQEVQSDVLFEKTS